MGIFSFPLNSWHVHKQIFASITPLNQVYKRLFSDEILSKLLSTIVVNESQFTTVYKLDIQLIFEITMTSKQRI